MYTCTRVCVRMYVCVSVCVCVCVFVCVCMWCRGVHVIEVRAVYMSIMVYDWGIVRFYGVTCIVW